MLKLKNNCARLIILKDAANNNAINLIPGSDEEHVLDIELGYSVSYIQSLISCGDIVNTGNGDLEALSSAEQEEKDKLSSSLKKAKTDKDRKEKQERIDAKLGASTNDKDLKKSNKK